MPTHILMVFDMMGSGRDLLAGVVDYACEAADWDCHIEAWGEGRRDHLADWDGVIGLLRAERDVRRIERAGLPAVNLSSTGPGERLPSILSDEEAEMALAVSHLQERGFRRLAFVGNGPATSTRRMAEIFTAQVGLAAPLYGVDRGQEPAVFRRVLARWLHGLPRPTGIIAANDAIGRQVLTAALSSGLQVPEDLAVVGRDDDAVVCGLCRPPLSSVRPDAYRMGFEAASLLGRLLRGDAPPTAPIRIRPLGVTVRRSSDIVAVEDGTMQRCLTFIRDKAGNGIDVDEVVAQSSMCRRSLERRFRDNLGRGIGAEILRVRLEQARHLLIHEDLSLTAIATRCGFSGAKQLSATFGQQLGESPTSYRSRYRTSIA